MTLPYDYARCAGTTHPLCQVCRRREPGRDQWQSWMQPPIDTLTGECVSFIEPKKQGATMNDDATPAKVRLSEGLAPVRKALDGLAFAAYEAGAVGETTLGDSADVAGWIAYAMREAEAARNAALNLWPRDCRLCAHFTTKSGGCTSVVQCVDSMQFKATAPRQYWVASQF